MRITTCLMAAGAVAFIAGCRGESITEAREDTAQGAHALSGWTTADDNLIAPIWKGDNAQGSLQTPMYRGAFPGIEDYIYAPADGDCTKPRASVRIDWDKAANSVRISIKGKNFEPHPTVKRTEGVDYVPNKFHKAPKDINVAGYRLWIILASVARTAKFYYDPSTLLLQGSEFDFVGTAPPEPSIVVEFPVFAITGSGLFYPSENGDVSHEYTLDYDRVTVADRKFSFAWATFIPHDLCQAAPLQPAISQLRPVISPWQPASAAPSWDAMLGRAIGLDIQIDDATPPPPEFGENLPYVFSAVSYLGNLPAMQGGVPKGSALQLVTALQQVAPMLAPVPGGNGLGCTPYIQEPHITAPRYCETPTGAVATGLSGANGGGVAVPGDVTITGGGL